jgi:hypothetical protein
MSNGPLSEVEYRAFVNMWLCRLIFCGKTNEPTLNRIVMAEDLAIGNLIPLGKYLLESVYHMLHQTTYLMHTSQKISCTCVVMIFFDLLCEPYCFKRIWELYPSRTHTNSCPFA